MMASIPAYNADASHVLMPTMDQRPLVEVKRLEASGEYEHPRYKELPEADCYVQHILHVPADQWPDPVNRAFKHLNPRIYVPMQGPSDLGVSFFASRFASWQPSHA